MKIGISTGMIQRGKTGIAQHLFGLLKALGPFVNKHDFHLFVLEEDAPLFQPFLDMHGRGLRLQLVSETWRTPVRNILWHQTIFPREAARLKLDVIHVPSYRRLVWSKACPSVGTIHDLAPFHLRGKYDPLRMFYGRVIVKRLAARQDALIAISQNTARDIQHFFGIPLPRISIVYNGLDHERFSPAEKGAARQWFQEKFRVTGPFFLYLARIEHPAKNHVRLIEAFEKFKERTPNPWQLVFAGSDWHGADHVHAAIGRSPFRKDIHALGFVPDADVADLYRAANVFVYPSLYEGFGLPPVEAMACGTPVISSRRGALGEVVGEAAQAIDPENVEEMAGALQAVAGSPGKQNLLVNAGLERARCFQWSKTAAATVAVYERAAQRESTAGARFSAPEKSPAQKSPPSESSQP